MTLDALNLHLGLKSDPIENRYSYDWLFRLLAEEDVHHLQFGSFVAMYFLPDDFYIGLRQQAADYGIDISTVFTTHREMGGFFRHDHPAWGEATRTLYRRVIEIGALVGASAIGSNPGAVLRDRTGYKSQGWGQWIAFMQEMMAYAHDCGLEYLTIEPMSCLAEPPTLPQEIRDMAEELLAYHHAHPGTTVPVGYCTDVTHGYADREMNVVWDNMQLFEAALPYTHHIHLKNTDRHFNSTFGFTPAERVRGVIDVREVRRILAANAAKIPMTDLICYLEIGGPKTGRDYSDPQLEQMLRQSLRYLQTEFMAEPASTLTAS
ncbi:MAG: sugar phosphate isomerase/epimerase [Caldilineales bacterium]|nr:sugar phosphate isomerase/epimerase [Caldilineales bacterium]